MAFGPKVAPRTFTKLVAVVAADVRKQSLRLAVYHDDRLGLNANRQNIVQDQRTLLILLTNLGFIINKKNSQLVPTQKITYIESVLDLQKGISNSQNLKKV
ncbi:hypothetical protein MAR_026175 [Mya arenaria]|uniref:Reverse transcriptase domain-containing protein n=1 Tax=Mya arenaria TaxID=6604 RepID=A0ABY7ERW1_MYAAR|nr:hypothetical protein MAR_026175 [Mya arenaria]